MSVFRSSLGRLASFAALSQLGPPPVKVVGPYIGQLGTRSRIPTQTYSGALSFSQRYYEYARDDITMLKIAHAQWDGQSDERAAGADVTYAAAIEYPIGGARHQFKFGGASIVTAADGATTWSDWLPVVIPAGEKFYVHQYVSGTKFPYNDGSLEAAVYNDVANGDATDYSGANLTMSGSYTDAGANAPFYAAALIGPTRRPSFGVIGDSRAMGYGDTVAANAGTMGEVLRSIGPNFAAINSSISNDTINNWVNLTNTAKRRALLQHCSHIICELGASDILNYGASAAVTLANLQTVKASFGGRQFYQTTYTPASTGTFTSALGQTTDANNSALVTANTNIRTGGNFTDIVDHGAVMEDTPGSGKWKSTGGVARTADGRHANPLGYSEIAAAGLYPPEMFTVDLGASYLPRS